MSHFESLHPALKYHIVNSLRWSELRPFQDAAIPHVLSGNHAIILAPTAGGKTESAVLPILSQILSQSWDGLSVLYICPMKALINDLGERLNRYFSLVGRRAAIWHGDVSAAARDRLIQDPPDLLLTTPESLEAILVSSRLDGHEFFGKLKAVVVDEIHLFASDDRGWHLLALLSRLKKISGNEFQRLGLSATVGNPEFLGRWLTGGCARKLQVLVPEEIQVVKTEIQLDYVGSMENAARVISRMHRGEKRLAFVDSRAGAEQLADALRRLDVRAFVTHSSLSKDERTRAEKAFQNDDNCVIIATSVLEVGVDVGDLDRVIQIDAPRTVSSFLQRMGRTGRRPGATRNCLFLTTRDDTLLRAAAIIQLFEQGFVEPIAPPKEPFHILAQQVLALCLQETGIGKKDWFDWIGDVPAFVDMHRDDTEALIAWMLNQGILFEDEGILGIGRRGEDLYSRRNYIELLSVFLSPPFFTVLHGRSEIGYVDEQTFMQRDSGAVKTILLGGRAWAVTHVDWRQHRAYVEPSEGNGGANWKSEASGLHVGICQAIKEILLAEDYHACYSRRAREKLCALRNEHGWLKYVDNTFVVRANGVDWWTFAGAKGNLSISGALQEYFSETISSDDLKVHFSASSCVSQILTAIEKISRLPVQEFKPWVPPEMIRGLKFTSVLPLEYSLRVIRARLFDPASIETILKQPVVLASDS